MKKLESEERLENVLKKILKEESNFRKASQRSCHDCGKPTFNYRCDDCWEKLRNNYNYTPEIDY